MAEATAADYAWFNGHWLRQAFCITLVRGLDEGEVLRRFGGERSQPRTLTAGEAGELSGSFHAGYPQIILATRSAGWTVAVEDNGWEGSRPEVLRSARLLRLLRLTRLVAFAVEGPGEVRGILRHRGLNWVLLIVLALNLIAAAAVLEFERGNPEATIHSYPDALWWAVTTITTVGYGDRFPMSPAGRGVAVVLMIAGIALFGVITATIAAYFVEQKAEEDLAGRLDQILKRLDRIEARLPAGHNDAAMTEQARR